MPPSARQSATESNWEWYRTFLSVIKKGSLSAAARTLGLTLPTVGRHIAGLEQALNLKLFTRSFEGFVPTEAAIELHSYAIEVAATAASLRRVASGHGNGVRGTVRVTASEVVGVEVLPILAKLYEEHSELTIELVLSNRVDDLLHREADIAVRMVQPTQDALIAKRIGSIELGLYASKRYIAKHGMPASLEELYRRTLIGFDSENEFIRRMQDRYKAFTRSSR